VHKTRAIWIKALKIDAAWR